MLKNKKDSYSLKQSSNNQWTNEKDQRNSNLKPYFFSTQEQKNNFTTTIHDKLSIKTCRVFVNVILLYDIVSQDKSI
jgi:hypothetical protein